MLSKSVIKKILLFSMVLGVLSLESWAQSGRLKEKVEYICEFIPEFGEYKPHLRAKYIHKYEYDEKGNMVEWARYNFQGELEVKGIYKYDEKGNRLEKTWYDSQGALKDRFFYKYDGKGNEIEATRYDSDGWLKHKWLMKYDHRGNMIEQISDFYLWSKSTYKYDEKGNMIEELQYDSKGNLEWKTICKYDEKGNMVEKVKRCVDAELVHETAYKYDKQGNMVEKIGYHPVYYHSQGVLKESDLGRTTYEYNKEGNEIVVMEYIWKSAFGKTQEIPVEKTVYEYEYY